MPAKKSAKEPLIAAAIEQRARKACNDLKPLTDPMSREELRERAELIDRVMRARQKLQLLRNRTEALKAALQRFKMQRDAMQA